MQMSSDKYLSMSHDRPIGWWVKELDRLLECSLDTALATEGATRREWQVLNVLAGDESVDVTTVADALAPFLSGGAGQDDVDVVTALLAALADRGWVNLDAGTATLTPVGAAARQRMMVRVGEQRARVVNGVTDQDYRTTMATLQRMVTNLRDGDTRDSA